jgi:glycosyltransferase involved in cell wall biosynthesis
MKIAYVLKWFPKLSETFILNEIVELTSLGHKIVIIAEEPFDKDIVSDEIEEYKLMDNVRYQKDTLSYLRELPFTSQTQAVKTILRRLFNPSSDKTIQAKNMKIRSAINKNVILKYKLTILADQLKEDGVDVIHAHFATRAPKALKLSEYSGIPFTFTAHAHDIFAKGALSESVITAMNRAAGIMVISNYNKQFLIKNIPQIKKDKINIVHCGIKLEKFKPEKGKSDKKKVPKILSVARLEEKKGFKYLIDAFNILNKKKLNFQATIVGGGTLKQMLLEMVNKYNLAKKVEFTGSLDDSTLMHLFKTSDIFALPCVVTSDGDRDGIPVSLMEAMALKMPVVSTTVSGVPELIEHEKNGLLVHEKDEVALAGALERMINNPKLIERYGTKSRMKIEKEFNIKYTVQRLIGYWGAITKVGRNGKQGKPIKTQRLGGQ